MSMLAVRTADRPEGAESEAGVALRPLGGKRYEVSLRGKFPPGWLGGFAAGLSKVRLGIVRGEAKKLNPALWQATFELDGAAAAVLPAEIDFLALTAGRADAAALCDLKLESFRLEREAGALHAEIRGQDRLGFLGALLRCFAFYALFPAEMAVETVGGKIHDRFWLKGVGGSIPSAEAVNALRDELQALIEG